MRLADAGTVFGLGLYVLPVVVAWCGFGAGGAFVLSLGAAAAGVVLRLRGLTAPADPSIVELHTITYSHYVEKVRWCLDRTGVAYREVPSVGILGLLLTARTVPMLVLPASRTSIGDSPKILRFLWGNYSAVLEPGRCCFLEPTPEALALEKHFDDDLGINVRLWSYWHLLENEDLTLKMWGVAEENIPQWQRAALPTLRPLLAALLKKMLGVTDARAAAALETTRAVFAEVDAMLADGRRYLMGGDEATFVDITFASLAALALFPENYGGRAVSIHGTPLEQMAPAWRAEVVALRETAAGRFVERLYREERLAR